jgi:hypothetical protein
MKIIETLTFLLAWVSAQSGLEWDGELPALRLVSQPQMIAELCVNCDDEQRRILRDDTGLVGYYDDAGTITLVHDVPFEWALSHEIVHYLQHRSGAKYRCKRQREHVAYKVSNAYAEMTGRDDLVADNFTVLMRSMCETDLY